MCRGVDEAINDRAEFTRFSPASIDATATIFARFGIDTFTDLRSTRADQRSHFLADAEKAYGFTEMKLVREIFATLPPVKKGGNIASVEFNEIHLPIRLKNFHVDLSRATGTLRPVQEMVNAISEEIARGESNPQPFHPYIIPNYHERPWSPRITAHITAFNSWKTKAKGAKKYAISLQMWLRHHMRFIMSAGLCSLWAPFGGIAAQFNHIAVLLSLATLESAGFSLRYHELLIRTLADCARERFPFDYFTALSEIHEETRRAITSDTARTTPTPQSEHSRSSKGKDRFNDNKSKGKAQTPQKGKKRSNKGVREHPTGKGAAPTPEQPSNANNKG